MGDVRPGSDLKVILKAALQPAPCNCSVSEFSMDEIVDLALHTYGLTRELDAARVAQSREKILRYISTHGDAEQHESHQLAVYALAYLKELHEGPDPRFTGC